MDEVNPSPELASEVCCKDEPGDPPSGAGRLECHVGFPMAANMYVPPFSEGWSLFENTLASGQNAERFMTRP